MREARIIAPNAAATWLGAKLLREFGGYTAFPAQEGGWVNPETGRPVVEGVTVFDVAMRDASFPYLKHIAEEMAILFGEDTVYVRDTLGEVWFVAPPTEENE